MNDQTKKTDRSRRKFLGNAAAVATVTAVPGLFIFGNASSTEATGNKVRWGMLVDATRCAKECDACVTACNKEHGLTGRGRPETDAQWIRLVHLQDKQTGQESKLPIMCQHCEHPPCVDVCPTGASFRRKDGIVLVDRHRCIGCRYCMIACPYKARSFVHESLTDQRPHTPRGKGTVEGCNLCVHRVDAGKAPACVEACHKEGNNALLFGDLNNPASNLSKKLKTVASRQLREKLRLNTGIRHHGI